MTNTIGLVAPRLMVRGILWAKQKPTAKMQAIAAMNLFVNVTIEYQCFLSLIKDVRSGANRWVLTIFLSLVSKILPA